ncbi:MAG: NAD(P)-dependent oxidoreductase [Candidatus Neomarinimicrobiota bacterium]
MKVVIIGSNGFIGRCLQDFLKEKGFEVQGFSSCTHGGIDSETGILSDTFLISGGTNAVVYLAQSPYYRQLPEMSWHLWNVNMVSAIKAAEIAHRSKVKRFIYASTGNVYNPSFESLSETSPLRRDSLYSLSKIHAEEALSLYRKYIDLTIIRIFGIYGPGQTDKLVPNLLNSVLEGKEVYVERNPKDDADLDGLKVSLCYIDDAIEILSNLIIKGGPPYINIAGNKAVSFRKIATSIGYSLKKNTTFKVLNRYRQFDLIADISLLKQTLNPQFTSFEIGLEKTIEYITTQK